MGYARTAGMSTAARRRRRRTALVLTALVLLLAVVFGYAAAYYQGWLPGEDAATDTEQVTSTAEPTEVALGPGDVSVNVYNASGVPGLAARTAEALEARGFVVDSIDNDPEGASIDHAADIRHGPTGAEAAALLQEQVPGAQLVPDEREGAEVDLVLGDAFEDLPQAEEEETGGDGDESTGGDSDGTDVDRGDDG